MLDLQKYIVSEVKLLKLSGFYPEKKPTVIHNSRAFLALFLNNFCIIHYYLNISNGDQDVLEFTSSILYAVGTPFVSLKFMAFLRARRNILKLEEMLASPILSEFSVDNEKIFEATVNSKFFLICKGIGIAFNVMAIPLEIKCIMEKKLFLPLKLFGSLEDNMICFYYLVLQISFSIIITWNYVLIDVFCYKLMSIATATLEILKNNLQNIPYENQQLGNLELNMKKNIILHKEILRFTSLINGTISYVALAIILSGALVNCVCGIIIFKIDLTVGEAFTFLLFCACVMNQIAIYCWFGEQIKSKSAEIGIRCYMTKWYVADVKIRKYLLIFVERAKNPIIFKAGYFFPLTLQTLATILQKSYSAFTVLQQFYKEK